MIEKTEYGVTGSNSDLPVWAQQNPELGLAGALAATASLQDMLTFTPAEQEFLIQAMDEQTEDKDRTPAFADYLQRNQATVRPKLYRSGPAKYTFEEVRYLLFTLGGAFAKMRRPALLEHLHFGILRKLIHATK